MSFGLLVWGRSVDWCLFCDGLLCYWFGLVGFEGMLLLDWLGFRVGGISECLDFDCCDYITACW